MQQHDIDSDRSEFFKAFADRGCRADEASTQPSVRDGIIFQRYLPLTQAGDLWLLGKHRIFCGNALDSSSFTTLMGKRRASVVFADVPYNVVIDGHATGNGRTKHREFAMASGEMDEAQFTAFLMNACSQLATWSADGSIHYVCMDFSHMSELLAAGQIVYDSLLNVCVASPNPSRFLACPDVLLRRSSFRSHTFGSDFLAWRADLSTVEELPKFHSYQAITI